MAEWDDFGGRLRDLRDELNALSTHAPAHSPDYIYVREMTIAVNRLTAHAPLYNTPAFGRLLEGTIRPLVKRLQHAESPTEDLRERIHRVLEEVEKLCGEVKS